MSSIKERITKKAHSDPRVTIDSVHSSIIKKLDTEEKNEYYLDNGLLLHQYYSGDMGSGDTREDGILSFFSKKDANEEYHKTNDIIEEYMSHVSDTYKVKHTVHRTDKCKICSNNMLYTLTNSELICKSCGYTETIIINSEKTSYKDPPREVSYFAYKRINHFNEWLAQFQAKESTEIPDNVYRDIHSEIEKNINLAYKTITRDQVRGILKKLGYNKYYEHIPHIINILTGKKAPSLTSKEEDQLRSLFKEIQTPFANNCPEDRKNFLSYSYVLHKLCELLEYDYLLPNFPLLKSREKLLQQDKIWKCICNDLRWQFIQSI